MTTIEQRADQRPRLGPPRLELARTSHAYVGPRSAWTSQKRSAVPTSTGRAALIERLNEDLSREYQAIIAYVVYSQRLKGAEYMSIAKELEAHAAQELSHALTIARHIDYLGGTPTTVAQPVKDVDAATEMLRADLDNENRTIVAYRERLRQCEALDEYAIAEDIREILRQEQEHQIDLATALGENVPDVSALAETSDRA